MLRALRAGFNCAQKYYPRPRTAREGLISDPIPRRRMLSSRKAPAPTPCLDEQRRLPGYQSWRRRPRPPCEGGLEADQGAAVLQLQHVWHVAHLQGGDPLWSMSTVWFQISGFIFIFSYSFNVTICGSLIEAHGICSGSLIEAHGICST